MCTYCKINFYKAPENYNPYISDYDSEGFDRNTFDSLSNDVYDTCMTILNKTSFYVDSNNKLQGYHWSNFPMRIISLVQNWFLSSFLNRTPDQHVEDKIIQVFTFILNINTKYEIPTKGGDICNTRILEGGKFTHRYATIAKKVLKQFSREHNEKLFDLAHRILHERPYTITILNEKSNKLEKVENIAKNAKGTVWEKTTVWNAA